eukprot:UN07967
MHPHEYLLSIHHSYMNEVSQSNIWSYMYINSFMFSPPSSIDEGVSDK